MAHMRRDVRTLMPKLKIFQCQMFQAHPPDEIARNPVLLTLLTLGSRVGAVRRSHMAPSYAYSCPPRAGNGHGRSRFGGN